MEVQDSIQSVCILTPQVECQTHYTVTHYQADRTVAFQPPAALFVPFFSRTRGSAQCEFPPSPKLKYLLAKFKTLARFLILWRGTVFPTRVLGRVETQEERAKAETFTKTKQQKPLLQPCKGFDLSARSSEHWQSEAFLSGFEGMEQHLLQDHFPSRQKVAYVLISISNCYSHHGWQWGKNQHPSYTSPTQKHST